MCATPRSGSSLLCESLRNTGLAGKPDPYFVQCMLADGMRSGK
ncbi:MAG: hypothetical protein E4H27_01520 [Anaerolineales bacterium]|nr:MAG: hypothetical protein E4H27_01520 [Anaerolineales bacterium]